MAKVKGFADKQTDELTKNYMPLNLQLQGHKKQIQVK